MTATASLVKSIKFKIEGRVASNHRRKQVDFVRRGKVVVKLDKPISVLDKDYIRFKAAAATFARIAMSQSGFEMIPLGEEFTLRLHFLIGTKALKYEKETGLWRVGRRSRPDVSNMVKCVEDALQGIVFKNDSRCNPVPMLGSDYGWITRFEGLDSQEVVDVEVIRSGINQSKKGNRKCRQEETKQMCRP